MILSGVMMLRHLGELQRAERLEKAIASVVEEGRFVTYDMKASPNDPSATSTSQVAEAIIQKLQYGS
jgi:isocitrate dehydrogenase (NAD+)